MDTAYYPLSTGNPCYPPCPPSMVPDIDRSQRHAHSVLKMYRTIHERGVDPCLLSRTNENFAPDHSMRVTANVGKSLICPWPAASDWPGPEMRDAGRSHSISRPLPLHPDRSNHPSHPVNRRLWSHGHARADRQDSSGSVPRLFIAF